MPYYRVCGDNVAVSIEEYFGQFGIDCVMEIRRQIELNGSFSNFIRRLGIPVVGGAEEHREALRAFLHKYGVGFFFQAAKHNFDPNVVERMKTERLIKLAQPRRRALTPMPKGKQPPGKTGPGAQPFGPGTGGSASPTGGASPTASGVGGVAGPVPGAVAGPGQDAPVPGAAAAPPGGAVPGGYSVAGSAATPQASAANKEEPPLSSQPASSFRNAPPAAGSSQSIVGRSLAGRSLGGEIRRADPSGTQSRAPSGGAANGQPDRSGTQPVHLGAESDCSGTQPADDTAHLDRSGTQPVSYPAGPEGTGARPRSAVGGSGVERPFASSAGGAGPERPFASQPNSAGGTWQPPVYPSQQPRYDPSGTASRPRGEVLPQDPNLPPGWVKTPTYTGPDRRKLPDRRVAKTDRRRCVQTITFKNRRYGGGRRRWIRRQSDRDKLSIEELQILARQGFNLTSEPK